VHDVAGKLPEPAFYVPFRHGRYEVAPGLSQVRGGRGFELDRSFAGFRAAKLASRGRGLSNYYCTSDLSDGVRAAVVRFLLRRLAEEWPGLFRSESVDGRRHVLRCALTRETLTFNDDDDTLVGTDDVVGYVDAIDALASQVQEDLAVVSSAAAGRHWLSMAHVMLPNGWAPAEKIGGSFSAIHEPVAGMAAMNRRGEEFARLMVAAERGLVRFAWGVTFDDELDHHPSRPRTAFDPGRPRAFARVERQTIWGFPAVGAAVFTIRTYVYDADVFRRDPALRAALGSGLRSMSAASRAYKGLAAGFEDLAAWIDGG